MTASRTWCAAAAAAALFSPALTAQYTWRKAGDRPPGRAGHHAFFDPVRGRTTVFAGQVGEIASAYDGDTLQVDDGGFVRIDAPVLPGRGYGVCCEDPVAFGCGIVFGGVDTAGTLVPDMLRWNRELHRFDTVNPAQSPPLRWISGMALDTTRRRAVLFGGGDYFGPLGDTWEWDGTDWQQRTPAQSPSPRANHALAFDAVHNRVVLFGGHDGAGTLADTWLYDGTTWTLASTPFAPGPRHNAMMGFDASTANTVLFGGKDDSGTLWEHLWFWNGTAWSGPMALAGPGRRELGSFTYDSQRQRLVLVGGQDQSGVRQDDAWEFGYYTGWRKLAPLPLGSPGPVLPVARHAAAYDGHRGRMVTFGGDTGSFNAVYPHTLECDGSAWVSRMPTPAPIRRTSAQMAYDSDLRRCLMIGGHGITSVLWDGLWSWDGTSWTQLSSPNPPLVGTGHAIAYDSGRRKLVLFGGSDVFNTTSNQHWEYDATTGWSQRTYANPVTPRRGHAMAYHAQSGHTYMFGGTLQTVGPTDALLLWNGSDWFATLPSSRPPALTDASLCYDAGRNRLVLFGGINNSFVNDVVYEYDGSNWAMRPATGDCPVGRFSATLVYDSNAQRCVLHGGTDGTRYYDDVWEWNGAALSWTRRAQGVPAPRGKGALSHDPVRNRTVAFGGNDSAANRTFADTWEWNGSTWTPRVPVTAPAARWGSAAAFDQRSGRTVLFGGRDAAGTVMHDVWTWDGTSWTAAMGLALASARCNHAMASLWPEPGIVMFGGSDGSLLGMGDCFLWDNGWRFLPSGPPARDSHAMAYDHLRRKVVMFGGHGGFFAFLGDTWEFDVPTRTWTQRSPAHAPSARWNHTMTYDAGRGRVVLAGGYSGAYMDDVWEWDGTDWQQRTPETARPPANEGSLLAYDGARGRCVLFGRWAPSPDNAVWELSATIDAAGRGNTANPAGLRYYTQPVRGQQLRLGFDVPQGLGFYLLGLGPVQQPLLQVPAPPLCEPGSIYANAVTNLVFGGSAEPNAAWTVPNSPLVLGVTLVLQGVSLQAGGCFRATDALHVVFR